MTLFGYRVPLIICLMACASLLGALMVELRSIRLDVNRNDAQRAQILSSVERLSQMLKANTAELIENTRKINSFNEQQRIKK